MVNFGGVLMSGPTSKLVSKNFISGKRLQKIKFSANVNINFTKKLKL